MIEAIWGLVSKNPILLGGVGTILFGAAMYLLRTIPFKIYYFLKHQFVSDLTYTTNSHGDYHAALRVLRKYDIKFTNRSYSSNDGKLIPGFGTMYAWYKNRLVRYSRSFISEAHDASERVDITFFSRDRRIIQSFVDEMESRDDESTINIHTQDFGHWENQGGRPKRSISSIIHTNNLSQYLLDEIKKFESKKDEYRRRGLTHKLVILLYGPPGTGKTSLIFALASALDRDISIVSSITRLINSGISQKSVTVIEDIDRVLGDSGGEYIYDGRIAEEDKDTAKHKHQNTLAQKDIHSLINYLDGLNTPDGLIMFITTNHIDRLDPAILRSSRVDLKIEVPPLDGDAMAKMIQLFHPEKSLLMLQGICARKSMTGAELQELLIQNSFEDLCYKISQRGDA